ncbi:MAG: monofunctional biosynthetic peptidoglycan transglycosylase [Deltaproteobacteria bacterium]|nr:monofunctional biosynthetic peptidoglycan transglycosylase [Deltaproteobacteria bacterium]
MIPGPATPRLFFTLGRLARWALIALLLPPTAFVGWLWLSMPDVTEYASKFPERTSLMRHREAEYARKKEKVKTSYRPVRLRAISPNLRAAVIASEDANFYGHRGFDFEGISEALEKDVDAGKPLRGGSTITQQLAKNLYLTPKKSIIRKVREAAIAKRLEEKLSKDRILELYLNVAEWGRGIYGCEAASRHWFSKTCVDLSPREAALLAAALPAPRKFNPQKKNSRAWRRHEKIIGWLCLGRKIPESECGGMTDD